MFFPPAGLLAVAEGSAAVAAAVGVGVTGGGFVGGVTGGGYTVKQVENGYNAALQPIRDNKIICEELIHSINSYKVEIDTVKYNLLLIREKIEISRELNFEDPHLRVRVETFVKDMETLTDSIQNHLRNAEHFKGGINRIHNVQMPNNLTSRRECVATEN